MSQVLQTNGNYTIKTSLNGDIILNTGPAVGRVIITGDLVVQGDTTDVNVADLFVEDNVITLNTGETGNGVTKGYAGIEVDRGTEDNASFVYNESSDAWQIVRGQNGTYSFTESNLKLRQLHFVDATGGDPIAPELTIVNAGLGALRLSGRTEYEDYVVNDNDVPNKKYVDRRIIENPTYQIVRDNSRVTVQDLQDPDDPLLLESRVVTVVDNNVLLTVYNNRVEIQNLEFSTNKIENPGTNENIRLVTNGTGKVEFDYAIQYNHAIGTPAMVPNTTLVYGQAPSPDGGSGVYYVNEDNSGELISKRKALTFSIIF